MALAGRQFACSNFSFERIAEEFTALLADRHSAHRSPTAEVVR
jgi:hypothetical protein